MVRPMSAALRRKLASRSSSPEYSPPLSLARSLICLMVWSSKAFHWLSSKTNGLAWTWVISKGLSTSFGTIFRFVIWAFGVVFEFFQDRSSQVKAESTSQIHNSDNGIGKFNLHHRPVW